MNRLKEIRIEMGLNMSEMARRLSMPYTTYVGYEKEERHMYPEALKKISGELGITIDYLLGRSEQKVPTTPKGSEREEEYEETYKEMVNRLMELSPEERQKVDAFVQGLLANR